MKDAKVCVVGAGIAGLSVAVGIAEQFLHRGEGGVKQLTVVSEEFTPRTTTNVAAGLWEPFFLGDGTDKEQLM